MTSPAYHRPMKFAFALLATLTTAAALGAESPLAFDAGDYVSREVTVAGRKIAVRAWENVAYAARPVDPTVQVMNIYVPEAHFRGERIGPFTAATAPIFLPNQVGGYMPAQPGDLQARRGPPAGGPTAGAPRRAGPLPGGEVQSFRLVPPGGQAAGVAQPNTIAAALARGFVVASPGARGRTVRILRAHGPARRRPRSST